MTSRAAPANQRADCSEPASEAPLLRITLLGGFHLSTGTQSSPLTLRRGRRTAQLIKLLALAPDHVLNREQIGEALWPEFPAESAANNLRQTLHLARRQFRALDLDASLLLSSQGDRVCLYPVDRLRIDAEAFELAARDALRSKEPSDCQTAIDLYGGLLLPEDIYADWTTARRESLASTYLTLLYEFARISEARGDDASASSTLRRITELEPGEERAHVKLMQLYARTGRRPLALRQYGQLSQALQRELDATPEPETQRLFEAIKSGSYPPHTGTQIGSDLPARSAGIGAAREVKTNLPHSLTSFVGRDRDLAGVMNLVSANRLVTLTGTGGCGKTRLAQEVGWQTLSEDVPPGLVRRTGGPERPNTGRRHDRRRVGRAARTRTGCTLGAGISDQRSLAPPDPRQLRASHRRLRRSCPDAPLALSKPARAKHQPGSLAGSGRASLACAPVAGSRSEPEPREAGRQ